MKRTLLAIVGLLTVATGVEAQDAMTVEKALAPLSGRNREGAAVIAFNADGTYRTLKEGSNAWVCYDRSGQPGQAAFAVQCTNTGNLARLQQNIRFRAQANGDRDATAALVSAAEANGTRALPAVGSFWLNMNGESMEAARIHTTVAVPNATAESLGLPDNGRAGGVWVMSGGTSEAHLMGMGAP